MNHGVSLQENIQWAGLRGHISAWVGGQAPEQWTLGPQVYPAFPHWSRDIVPKKRLCTLWGEGLVRVIESTYSICLLKAYSLPDTLLHLKTLWGK